MSSEWTDTRLGVYKQDARPSQSLSQRIWRYFDGTRGIQCDSAMIVLRNAFSGLFNPHPHVTQNNALVPPHTAITSVM